MPDETQLHERPADPKGAQHGLVKIYLSIYFVILQIQRGSSVELNPLMRYIVEQVQLLCKKPPKGFEKYFEAGAKKPPKGSAEKTPAAGKKPGGSDNTLNKPPVSKPSTSAASESKSDWNFGMFSNSTRGPAGRGSGGPGGRPLGDGGGSDRDRWILLGAIGAVVLVGSFAFFEMGYKEISWKEFVNR